ncbi:MAG: alpha/beta fold hydrolase [Candidatus Marinimicrobia bacterium]|nr:alpha/beta fold hydrolase [Candidatus Neomarinimicrobiota bacterium]
MKKFQPKDFKPANWLPNGHFQTVFASLLMPVAIPPYKREILDLPDGDIVAADWVDGNIDKPLLVLIHGMEGGSESRYARLLMNECISRGWTGVVLHMRSCGGLMNRLRNYYHAGFYQDIEYFLDQLLPARGWEGTTYLAGISLGGSQVVHYLAKGQARERVKSAVIISAPMDLGASADFMSKGLSRHYVMKFQKSLLAKYYMKEDLINDSELGQKLAEAKNFWDLDNAATAPLHGFRDAKHYYGEMSAKKCLKDIQVPALYLASKDDPFVPEHSMPKGIHETGMLQSILTEQGGHVGFVNHYGKSWMAPTVFEYFSMFETQD